MRSRTQGVWFFASLLAALSGCASTQPATKPDLAMSQQQRELEERQRQQDQRIAELEARIALLEADARLSRDAASTPGRQGETIRIGASHAEPESSNVAIANPEPESDSAANTRRVPSLRLHGRPEAKEARGSREPLPPLPVVNETLPVVPLPEQRAREEVSTSTAAPVDTLDRVQDYRGALRALQDRRFDAAIESFSKFLSANPNHALASNAIYWRGEARYAKREYKTALREFEDVLSRYPDSDKAPDALFKAALCHRHLGAEDKAQAAFRRLRATYPNSQAASVASREGST